MGKGLEDATRNLLLGIHGLALKSMGGFQALPVFRRKGSQNQLGPTLVCFQMRSRDISIEEWKGSETYSPNTAYGKTPALTPPAGAMGLGSRSQRPGQAVCPGLFPHLEAIRGG